MFRVAGMSLLLLGVTAYLACAAAAEPDPEQLIKRLQADLSCPLSSKPFSRATSGDMLRYVGDTRVFRVAVRAQAATGSDVTDDKYEIAFNFADIASVQTVANDLVFTCRAQSGPSCIARPPAETGPDPYWYRVSACDVRSAADAREASEALMRMNASAPAAARPTVLITPAKREMYWLHNESTLNLVAEGSLRKFYYWTISPQMAALGVTPGTLLFDGRRSGDQYAGVAYVFSRACGRASYQVSGTVSADDREVTLSGRAPRRGSGCAVIDYRDDLLKFTLQEK